MRKYGWITKSYVSSLKKKYKLSKNEYVALLDKQEAKCYICGSSERLVVDHNHKTGKVRKLLCFRCNTIIGALEGSPERLEAIERYLTEHDS